MSFTNAQQARFLLHVTELAPKLSQVSVSSGAEMLDVTTLSDTAKRFIAGLSSGELSVDGWLDGDAFTAAFTAPNLLETLLGQPTPATYVPSGYAVGSPAVLGYGRRATFEAGSPVGGVTNFRVSLTGDGHVAHGFSLHANTAETDDGNGTSYDRGISSANGAVAHLHVTAFSGLTNNIVTIEDSANNSDFATIGTFSTVNATGSYRIEVSGTIRRYVRAVWNVTGTGSTSFVVAFAAL